MVLARELGREEEFVGLDVSSTFRIEYVKLFQKIFLKLIFCDDFFFFIFSRIKKYSDNFYVYRGKEVL